MNSRECRASRLKAIVLLVREGKISFHASRPMERELALYRRPKRPKTRG